MTLVAEVRQLDDAFGVQRLVRLLVTPSAAIEVVELQHGGGTLAHAMLEESLVDPFGRTVTSDDGADFLRTLRWTYSSDLLWVTPPADVPDDQARDPDVELPEPIDDFVPATIPYPEPPAELDGVRVVEIRRPAPDDYQRTEVVARLVHGSQLPARVEGHDPAVVLDVQRLLGVTGHPLVEVVRVLPPGFMAVPVHFDQPGNRAWREAILRARHRARLEGDHETVARLDLEFVTRLPRVWLSRCPFTGEVLRLAIDAWAFDGPFWDPASPLRPLDDDLPETFLGIAGAVVDEPPPALGLTPRASIPIPDEARGAGRAPLFRSIVDHPDVHAVLSATRVGGRRCDLVAYFARPRPERPPHIREWGTRLARVRGESEWRWAPEPAVDPPVEADPGPLLRSGRVAWIEPFDMGVELRSGPDGCPWLADQVP